MKYSTFHSCITYISQSPKSLCNLITSLAKPYLKNILSFFRYGYLRRTIIIGMDNLIDVRSFCAGTFIKVVGHGNKVTILEGATVEGLEVFIFGNKNQ